VRSGLELGFANSSCARAFKRSTPWPWPLPRVVADVDVAGAGKNGETEKGRGGKKKGEGEPGRHNYKLHRYTQITRLLCASQPPDDHAYAHASSAVAREKTGKRERERERERERDDRPRRRSERNADERARTVARAQLPFILSDAVRASRAQIARAIEFSLSGRRDQPGVFSQCRGVAAPGRIGPRSRVALDHNDVAL